MSSKGVTNACPPVGDKFVTALSLVGHLPGDDSSKNAFKMSPMRVTNAQLMTIYDV